MLRKEEKNMGNIEIKTREEKKQREKAYYEEAPQIGTQTIQNTAADQPGNDSICNCCSLYSVLFCAFKIRTYFGCDF